MNIDEKEEIFDIVDLNGTTRGQATRAECHAGSFLLHQVVHLHLFNSKGDLYLQKRSINKKIQPGKWDTAVGGHIDSGEQIETALMRESYEELGIEDFEPRFIGKYPFKSDVEYELVNIYSLVSDKKITIDPKEIAEGRFWPIVEIEYSLGKGIFTPNFISEFKEWVKPKILNI